MARPMKDSGVEWLGDIPADWKIVKTKHFYSNQKEIVGELADNYQRLALTLNGVIKRAKDDSTGLQPETFNSYQVLRENELVFKLIDLANVATSRVGYSPYTGIVSPAYIVLRPHKTDESRFGEYYFLSMWQREVFNHLGDDGVRSSLNASDLLNLPYIFAPDDEKKKVVAFLDDKCARIDSIVAKTRATIAEYKKLKQAVITRAVTKGIRPNRPMKDSGIEWLGEVPADWDVLSFTKSICSIVDYRGKTPEKQDEGTLLVTARNIKDGKIDYACSREFVRTEDFDEIMHRGKVEMGDVLFTTEAPLGSVANADRTDFALAQRIIKFRGFPDVLNNYYLKYWIMSDTFQQNLVTFSTGSTAKGIKASKLGMLKQIIPPLAEQGEIAAYLDEKTAAIDSLVAKKNRLVSELESLKKSLIFEYVTGKKEIV